MSKKIRNILHIILIALIIISAFSSYIPVKAASAWNKYKFSEKEIKGIARVCQQEQGSPAGAAAEASLMANRFELYKNSSGSGTELYNYIKSSGWWNNASSTMSKWSSVDSKIYTSVKDVLVNGNRTLPQYVDEHDCIDCGSYGYNIKKIVVNGKTITNKTELKKHSNYIQDKTVIYNTFGSVYTFYSFPTDSGDPFGYTKQAYEKADKDKKASNSNTTSKDNSSKIRPNDDGSKEELAFYKRVETIYNELESNGSNVEPGLIAGVFYVSNTYGQMKYKDFTTEIIKDLFKYMNSDPNVDDDAVLYYDESSFKANLLEHWFTRDEFSSYSNEKKEEMAEKVIQHFEEYKYLMGATDETSGNGTCSYKIGNQTISNIKVQLLKCEGNEKLDEDPYDFEEYIMGVVRSEIGEDSPLEALKAQAIAARSFALNRSAQMNGQYGVKQETQSGQTTLFLRSCTNDQVFCNPDKGCWSNVKGGQTTDESPWSKCTVYSGYDKTKTWTRDKLPEDSNVRKAVEETRGQYAVNASGKAIVLNYTNVNQEQWISDAKAGKDYFEILKKDYSNLSTITSNCTSSTGNSEAENWKQYDEPWGSKYIGRKTIKQIGCMVTSTAIQIARSGTKLLVSNFDPGVFMETIKAHGAFNGNNWNNMSDSTWSSIAPNFKLGGGVSFSGSKANKISQMKKYTEGNNYLIIQLFHPGQHWVAVTKIEGDKIYMADPGSTATEFTSKYDISTVSRGYYFVKGD